KEEVTAIAFATVVVAKAYVIDTRYEMAFVSDVTERVKRAFRHNEMTSRLANDSDSGWTRATRSEPWRCTGQSVEPGDDSDKSA
ncbi:MAG: hypothetical protein ACPHCN_18470, partial [Mycobacterium sp.]